MGNMINSRRIKPDAKKVFFKFYTVTVCLTFCITLLNLFAREFFRAGVVVGVGNGSSVALVVMGGSGEWLGWASSGIGMEAIRGLVVGPARFESSAQS